MVFLAILFLLTISSAVVYHLEHEAQPDDFSSIPAAMWWGVATLTTVGYGDVTPITGLGKFFGSIIALLGVGLFALPAGILGSGFITVMRRKGGGPSNAPTAIRTSHAEVIDQSSPRDHCVVLRSTATISCSSRT